ncbi:LysR family transcriptional regulator [Coprococcus catus]|uniref:LysR family transcriptional regulator n=1 Tax=Lachnospiraceae TaxID=186803 RepID=UPI002A7B3FDE|nr:LysR family transcriptional regulator [bacterium]MDD7144243.1 LysR family transcriptional regulator [bacterium]MDY2886784.1 LysR family transcriptional regulator [Bariatricus sp.]MDY3716406.1 LysR family transcriptional regulator [Blautia sp.]MDY5458099.1 LysR family transcriptional regulator [Bariatricus sp.]
MEFREISTFLQVAKFKSFSRAAEQLGYTQAAVTIQIKNLENELGVHLFDRIGKQTLLTHQGRIFYNYASNITREISQAKDALSNPDELTGKLCLGTIESVCASVFPVLLREYHRRYPKVNIKIVTDSPEILLHMMDKNTLDIVYFLDKPVYNTKWVKVLEKPEEVFFVSSSENPLSKRRELNLDEVICQPFISTEKDASYRLLLEESLAEKGYELHPFLETGNTEFIINQLRHNLGVSFLPGFIVKKDLDEGRLSRLDVRDFHLQVCRQIVYHKDKWVTREMKAFLELAQDFL